MIRLGPLTRTAALLLATAVFAGACGSGDSDPLTLDEYFAAFEAIDADVDSQVEALFSGFPEDEDPFADEANLEFLLELVDGFPRVIGDLVESAKDLDPPSEVADAHNELIDAGEALLVVFEEGADVMGDAGTMAELEALNLEVEPSISVAEAAFDAACEDVVAIAVANDIAVDVTCADA